MKDRIMEILLSAFDGVLNLVTLGAWIRWQGSRIPNLKIVKSIKE